MAGSKYEYKNMSLYEYCEKNGLKYNSIMKAVAREKKKSTKKIEVIIEECINKYKVNGCKYFYKNVPLVDYCAKKGYSYHAVLQKILEYSKTASKNENVVKKVLLSYEQKMKYFYQNIPLVEYCEQKGLNYNSITDRIRKNVLKSDDDLSEIIEEAIKSCNKTRYYYSGLTLRQYCINNDLNYHTIYNNVSEKVSGTKTNDPKEIELIIKDCIENYEQAKILYTYKGQSLFEYCRENNISYDTIKSTIYRKALNGSENILEIIEKYFEANEDGRQKYFIDGISLKDYVFSKGYSLMAVYSRIKRLKKQNVVITEKVLKNIMLELEEIKQQRELQKLILDLKNDKITDYVKVCNTLNIDKNCVIKLMERGYLANQAILFIWFFSKNKTSKKTLTDSRINCLEAKVELLKHLPANYDYESLDLYELIALYQCDLFDTRTIILKKEFNFFRKYVNACFFKCCISTNDYDKEDLINELGEVLLKTINKAYLNIPSKTIEYCLKTVKGYAYDYIEYHFYNVVNNIARDYDLNDIVDPNTTEDDFQNIEFSNITLEAMTNLTDLEQKLIKLRFIDCLTLEDISLMLKIKVRDAIDMENKILSVLKENILKLELKKTIM